MALYTFMSSVLQLIWNGDVKDDMKAGGVRVCCGKWRLTRLREIEWEFE